MDVEDHRQWAGRALGSNDAGADRAPLPGVDLDPLLIDVGTLDTFSALQVGEDLAALLRWDLVDPGMRIDLLAQLLRLGLEGGCDGGEAVRS